MKHGIGMVHAALRAPALTVSRNAIAQIGQTLVLTHDFAKKRSSRCV